MSVMGVNMQAMLGNSVVEAMSAFRTDLMLIVMVLLVSVFITSTTSSLRKSAKRSLEKKVAALESDGEPATDSTVSDTAAEPEATVETSTARDQLLEYNVKLDLMANEGNMDGAPAILAEMKDCGIKTNVRTLGHLVKGYCNAGDMDRALPLFKELVKTTSKQPHGFQCFKVLDGCLKAGYYSDGLQVVKKMQKHKINFESGSLRCAVLLLAHNNLLEDAFKLVQSASSEASMDLSAALIEACFICRSPAKAFSTFRKALAADVQPEMKTMNMITEGCLAHGNIDMALEVVRCAFQLPGHSLTDLSCRPGVDATVLRRVAFMAAKTDKSLYTQLERDLQLVGIDMLVSPLAVNDVSEIKMVRRKLPAVQVAPVLKEGSRWVPKPIVPVLKEGSRWVPKPVTCTRWRKADK